MILHEELNRRQIDNALYIMEDIITCMSPQAVNELVGGYENDLDRLFDNIFQEIIEVLNFKGHIDTEKLEYLNNVTAVMHETLQIQVYNYFKTTVLDNFTQQARNLEWGNLVQLFPWSGYLCQRGSGKSYEFCYAFQLWRLFSYTRPTKMIKSTIDNNNRKETCLITNEKTLARLHVEKIIEEIKFNEILAEKLNPKGKATLGVDGITTETGSKLHVRSYGSFIRGLHVGACVVDDFLDESSMYSKEQRDKYHEIFFAAIKYIVEQYGYLIVSGTPFHERDLYADLKLDDMFAVFEYPGIMPDGSLLAPDRFTYEFLKGKQKADGSLVFAREVLVSPISDDASLFPYTILKPAYEGNVHLKLVNNIESFPVKFVRVVIGCDFAMSGSIGADYTVYAVWGMTSTNHYYLLDVWRKQGASPNEQLAMIASMDERYRPNKIVCEANNFQAILSDMGKQMGINSISTFTTTAGNKKDLKSGLPSLAAIFERLEIKIPYGDDRSKQMAHWLAGEFNSMTFNQDKGTLESASEHDDGVMATFMAINELRENGGGYTAYMI